MKRLLSSHLRMSCGCAAVLLGLGCSAPVNGQDPEPPPPPSKVKTFRAPPQTNKSETIPSGPVASGEVAPPSTGQTGRAANGHGTPPSVPSTVNVTAPSITVHVSELKITDPNNSSATSSGSGVGPGKGPKGAALSEWQQKFLERIMEDLKVQGLPVSAVELRSEKKFFFSYSAGRLVVHTSPSTANAEDVRDYILDWVRHFSHRDMSVRQIRYPEKVLSCERGVLSLPEFELPTDPRK